MHPIILCLTHPQVVLAGTAGYFGYVALGGVSARLHKHIYTGDANESVLTRLKKGKPVIFSEETYEEFFTFKEYRTTFVVHVLTAAAWLLTGVYNLRNQPEFAGIDKATKTRMFDGWLHARLSGYIYVVSSFLKGVTAIQMSLNSHSLGSAKWLMSLYGVWDIISLAMAMYYIKKGDVASHKVWMIRNFGMGSGSIWCRVIGAAWGLFDLSFMGNPDLYREMNTVVLSCGFTQGWMFTEWWLADKGSSKRKSMEYLQLANVLMVGVGARQVYKNLRLLAEEEEKAKRTM